MVGDCPKTSTRIGVVSEPLLQLGARKDLRVEEGACERPGGGPEPFPNVNVTMNVLGLGESRAADHGGEVVPAHWRMVDLRLDNDPLWQAEGCELLEQIKHTFLPLFATRKVDYHSECVPHQVAPGGTWLRAEVLVADATRTPPKGLVQSLEEFLAARWGVIGGPGAL
jgi:hypothetical protein